MTHSHDTKKSCTGLYVEILLNCHCMTCIWTICWIIYRWPFIILLLMLEVTVNCLGGRKKEPSNNNDELHKSLLLLYAEDYSLIVCLFVSDYKACREHNIHISHLICSCDTRSCFFVFTLFAALTLNPVCLPMTASSSHFIFFPQVTWRICFYTFWIV